MIQITFIYIWIIDLKELPYHHSRVLAEGGLYLCRLGSEGRVTAASHQQGGVYAFKTQARHIQHGNNAASKLLIP